jgi:hypothetical protein
VEIGFPYFVSRTSSLKYDQALGFDLNYRLIY